MVFLVEHEKKMKLHSKYGINVPRSVVQVFLAELDLVGTQQRKAHCLRRRRYSNPGPNYSWHSDGYDKLKPYGFPIHACIDGFSRRLIWLRLTRSNNDPHIIASFFLESIKELQACPTLLRTDRGTENGSMATDMVDGGELDTSNHLHMECLWFSFNKVIENELSQVQSNWNNHYIRKSRYQTVAGIPNKLYFLPEEIGSKDYKKPFHPVDLNMKLTRPRQLTLMKATKPVITISTSTAYFTLLALILQPVGEKA
ncbi:uncharacterized protein LOC114528336 [Dendronephthya gigantea]|uniref:uncharacterized protein LOC114528336 n=1 Tax=Dendronephthya gigantea TaxID=151771 RepID=UPI0010697879|nr:uncharacterized protein LOC114528336 [Dendronephthya gigantea]